jgi:hypothetical protein
MSDYLEKGINSLKEVCIKFLAIEKNEQPLEKEQTQVEQNKTDNCTKNEASFFNFLLENNDVDDYNYDYDYNTKLNVIEIKYAIDNEIKKLTYLIKNEKFTKVKFSTRQFWIRHSSNLPYLGKLSAILLNIPASSAFIERFFSICGIVCEKRRLAMKDDLIIIRTLLKGNMKVLEELNFNCDDEDDFKFN